MAEVTDTLTVRIPVEVKRKLTELARQAGVPRATLVRRWLEKKTGWEVNRESTPAAD